MMSLATYFKIIEINNKDVLVVNNYLTGIYILVSIETILFIIVLIIRIIRVFEPLF